MTPREIEAAYRRREARRRAARALAAEHLTEYRSLLRLYRHDVDRERGPLPARPKQTDPSMPPVLEGLS